MKHQRKASSAHKPSISRRIQRRSTVERRRLLGRYERSGLSQSAFCLRYGVALSTLTYWRRREREESKQPGASFVEVPQVGGMVRASAEAAVVIELPGGVRLEVAAGTDAQWLSGLLRALGRAGCSR
jgi:transposase-like protein